MKPSTTGDFLSVRELAALVVSMRKVGVADRAVVTRTLRNVMERYPEYLGLWCVFETNTFDGHDADFVGQRGHDATGRFAPRWNRNGGPLSFGCSQGHDSPILGEWYALARESRQEVVFGPYDEQPLTGLPILCLSRIAPILERGRFIGAVGVDVSLDAMANDKRGAHHPLEGMLGRSHIFLAHDLSIQSSSRRARALLTRHVGASRPGHLPLALQVRLTGTGQSAGVLKFLRPDGGLHVVVVRHPHSGQKILSLEEVAPRRPIGKDGAAISAREQEVLEWLCAGKSNPEIALILDISEHTVRHHLERIFGKLGVENRHAAMGCVSQARAPKPCFLSRVPTLGAPGDGTVRLW